MSAPEIKFRLPEFKAIARWLDKKLTPPLAFFCKGWLYALETLVIDAKVEAALNKAEADYRASQGPLVSLTKPTYTSEPSEVEGLDIISYSYNVQEQEQEVDSPKASDDL